MLFRAFIVSLGPAHRTGDTVMSDNAIETPSINKVDQAAEELFSRGQRQQHRDEQPQEPGRSPSSQNEELFKQNIQQGVEAARPVPEDTESAGSISSRPRVATDDNDDPHDTQSEAGRFTDNDRDYPPAEDAAADTVAFAGNTSRSEFTTVPAAWASLSVKAR